MACALNFNSAIKKLFGNKYSLEKEQAFSIQFTSIDEGTARALMAEPELPQHIKSYVMQFEAELSQEEYDDPRFSYRVAFVKKITNSRNAADKVIQFVPSGSGAANSINEVILKETEKTKYRPGSIVNHMKALGYTKFKMKHHIDLWKVNDAKDPRHQYGVEVERAWFWYEPWIAVVRKHCEENEALYKPPMSMFSTLTSAADATA
jgi:hypothetical protein